MRKKATSRDTQRNRKKTRIGDGKFSKKGHKGGGANGSTTSKLWKRKKPSRGQGK